MTRGELEDRITSEELTDWMGYYRIEPFGDMRADLRMGILAATYINSKRGRGKRPISPSKFMPFLEKPVQSAKIFRAKLAHLVRKKKGKDGQKE